MNPQDMFLSQPASSQPLQSTSQPLASTSSSNGIAQTLTNGAASTAQASASTEGAEGETTAVISDKPKSKKELEQERDDLDLAELLESMDEWKPVIPDEVTSYYLQRSGFETSDVRVKRLLALATQRFISSISSDAFQYARTRTAAGPGGRTGGGGAKDRTRTVLTMEDLSAALKEYGVGADRAQYYL
ncbi:transcription initiation factor TFIID subunit 10 [Pseudohyphozyma bogoriensis]|nr:transcription initiation factor TFIID subunit 10 [Pseudohyphozyma bogoriensis]